MFKKIKNRKGFTLIEMMAVIAIVAILVAIVVPIVNNARVKAQAATDAANLRSMAASIATRYVSAETPEQLKGDLENPISSLYAGASVVALRVDNEIICAYTDSYLADMSSTTVGDTVSVSAFDIDHFSLVAETGKEYPETPKNTITGEYLFGLVDMNGISDEVLAAIGSGYKDSATAATQLKQLVGEGGTVPSELQDFYDQYYNWSDETYRDDEGDYANYNKYYGYYNDPQDVTSLSFRNYVKGWYERDTDGDGFVSQEEYSNSDPYTVYKQTGTYWVPFLGNVPKYEDVPIDYNEYVERFQSSQNKEGFGVTLEKDENGNYVGIDSNAGLN